MRAASCLARPWTEPERSARPDDVHAQRKLPLDAWGAALDAGRLEHVLLVFLCFAAVVPLLFLGRSADGNALTSWRWTFTPARALELTLLLVPAMLTALAISRVAWRGTVASALVACAAGAAVLPLWSAPEVVLDAARYLVQARFLEEHGLARFLREWGRGLDAWTDLPLVPLLHGLAFSALGESRAVAQALGTLLLGATAWLTFRIARELWGEEAGLHAALLLLAIPFLLVQAPLLLVDVPAAFFLALSTLALLRAARGRGALPVVAAGLAAAAAALTKYSLWPMLAVVAAGAALAAGADRRRAAARILGAVLVGVLVVGAAAAARADVLERQLRLLAEFQGPGLGRWREGLLSTFLFQTHPLVTALAALGAVRAAAARDARFLLPAGGLALALAIGATRARYAIPLLPFVAIAAARGLAAVADGRARRLVTLCAVATSLLVAHGAYLPFLKTTSFANLERAGAFLDALDAPDVEVRALAQFGSSGSTFAAIPLLDYATRKRIVSAEPWPGDGDGSAGARTSPLRFTWELRRPAHLAGPPPRPGAPVVVLSSEPPAAPPGPGLRERAQFAGTSGVFRYRTVVTVYEREPRS